MPANIIIDFILWWNLPIIHLKVTSTKTYAKNYGPVSYIIICFPISIIIASQALKVGGVFQGQITW